MGSTEGIKPPIAQEVIILGSGPAGLAAAIYAARAERKPLVFAGIDLGGQAALTSTIENYPGFPDGVGGADLGSLFQKQAERFGAVIEYASANAIQLDQNPFRVAADTGEYTARAIILAVGASPRKLGVPGEKELTGKGVSYCGTCDGWFFKGKEIFVVGGGDSALEESIFLTRYAARVTVVHRRDALRAGKLLQERARANEKIHFRLQAAVEEISGKDAVKTIRVRDLQTGNAEEVSADGIFIFVGHDPNTGWLRGKLAMDEKVYIQADSQMRTSVPGVFAAGEVADPVFRQVATSAGMGVAAAISAERWLSQL
jgi:thioredoxin reductase (NADPH)